MPAEVLRCQHELLCTEATDRIRGVFAYSRSMIPHIPFDDYPGRWFEVMAMIAEGIQSAMNLRGVKTDQLKWQFMIPLTIINGEGEYVCNPCSLLET